MTVSTTKMTARQFLLLGEDPPGVRLELVDGEIAVSPSPIPRHSFAVLALARILGGHVKENSLGELFGDVDTIFGEYDVRRPDLLYFNRGRLHLIGEKAMEGPPDLAVEVLSPSSVTIDRKHKFEQYRKGRVANYWIIDPGERTAEAFVLKRGKYVDGGSGRNSDVVRFSPFPDLDLPLADLWRPSR